MHASKFFVKYLKDYLLVALVNVSLGCTVLSDRNQTISVDSEPRGSSVYLNGSEKSIGTTPFFYQMRRRSAHELVLESKESQGQKFDLDCKARWVFESFANLPLLLFTTPFIGAVYAGGVATDFLMGSGYECPERIVVALPHEKSRPPALQCKRILIADVQTDGSYSITRLEHLVEAALSQGVKKCDVVQRGTEAANILGRYRLSPEERAPMTTLTRMQWNEIGLESSATHIAFARFSPSEKKSVHTMKVDVYDLHTHEKISGHARDVPSETTVQLQRSRIARVGSAVFSLFPNSIVLNAANTNLPVELPANVKVLREKEVKTLPSILSSWTLTSTEHPDAFARWDFAFRGFPSLKTFAVQQRLTLQIQHSDGNSTSEYDQLVRTYAVYIPLMGQLLLNTPAGEIYYALGTGPITRIHPRAKPVVRFFPALNMDVGWHFFVSKSFFTTIMVSVTSVQGDYFNENGLRLSSMNSASIGIGYHFSAGKRVGETLF